MTGGDMTAEAKEVYDKYFDSQFWRFNEHTKEQYDTIAEAYDLNYRNLLPENKNADILDIGCGAGNFLYYLIREGYDNYYGIDISKQQTDVCKEFVTDRLETIDAFKFLDGKKEIYDLIVMNDFLEHVSKTELIVMLKLTYTALKDGGTLLIKVPNMANPLGLRARYIDITHEIGFTEESLYQILSVIGFTHIHMYSYKVVIRSIKNRFKMAIRTAFFRYIRFLYYLAAYDKPNILTVNIIAVGKKTGSG